jgi:hypothetical protein
VQTFTTLTWVFWAPVLSGFSLLSSGRSCRFADCDLHTQPLIEGFSKEKVGKNGRAFRRASSCCVSRMRVDPLSRPSTTWAKRSRVVRYSTVVFQNCLPKLFVPVPDWGRKYAARACDIGEDGTSNRVHSLTGSRGSVANCRYLGKQDSACCMYRAVYQVAGCSLHKITYLACANT